MEAFEPPPFLFIQILYFNIPDHSMIFKFYSNKFLICFNLSQIGFGLYPFLYLIIFKIFVLNIIFFNFLIYFVSS